MSAQAALLFGPLLRMPDEMLLFERTLAGCFSVPYHPPVVCSCLCIACISNRHQPENFANIESKQHIPSLLYAMRIADFFLKPVTSLSSNSMDTTAGRFPVITISMTGCCFRKTQRHRTRNGAMPLCLFWHSFLVSAGYLPNTVFLIIKIC
jgi:hypothetical protein